MNTIELLKNHCDEWISKNFPSRDITGFKLSFDQNDNTLVLKEPNLFKKGTTHELTFKIGFNVDENNIICGEMPLYYVDDDGSVKPSKRKNGEEMVFSQGYTYVTEIDDIVNFNVYGALLLFINNWFYTYEPCEDYERKD